MQGIMTVIFGQLCHKLSGHGGRSYAPTQSTSGLHPVIEDAGFAAMLKEIDGFSEQLRAAETQQRAASNVILKRLHLGKTGSTR